MSKSEKLHLAQEFLGRMLAIFRCLLAVALFAGCASTEFTSSQPLVNEKLPRPNYI